MGILDLPPAKLRPTPQIKRIITNAFDEARRYGFNLINSQHLLIALLEEGESVASKILRRFKLDAEQVRRHFAPTEKGLMGSRARRDDRKWKSPEFGRNLVEEIKGRSTRSGYRTRRGSSTDHSNVEVVARRTTRLSSANRGSARLRSLKACRNESPLVMFLLRY